MNRILSVLLRVTQSTFMHKNLEHFVTPRLICMIYISADSPPPPKKRLYKICDNGLSHHEVCALLELQASQKFCVYVYVNGPQTEPIEGDTLITPKGQHFHCQEDYQRESSTVETVYC